MRYLIIAILLLTTPVWAKDKPTIQKDGLTYTFKSRSKIKDMLIKKGYKSNGKVNKLKDLTTTEK